MTLDPAKTYIAEVETSCGDVQHHARPRRTTPKARFQVRCSSRRKGFYDGPEVQPERRRLRGAGRMATTRATRAIPATRSPTEIPKTPAGSRKGGRGLRRRAMKRSREARHGSQFFVVSGENTNGAEPEGQQRGPRSPKFGTVTVGSRDVAQKIEWFAPDSGNGDGADPGARSTSTRWTITER